MKILVITFIFYSMEDIFAAIPPETSEDKVDEYITTCMAENGFNPGLINGAVNLPNHMMSFSTKEKMSCYIVCLYKKFGIHFSDLELLEKASKLEEDCV